MREIKMQNYAYCIYEKNIFFIYMKTTARKYIKLLIVAMTG